MCTVKRGPAPNKGLGFAIPVALALGRVMFFVASPYYPGDFLIAGTGYFAVIRLHLAEKIGATIPEIQKDYYRSLVSSPRFPAEVRSAANSGSIRGMAGSGSSASQIPASKRSNTPRTFSREERPEVPIRSQCSGVRTSCRGDLQLPGRAGPGLSRPAREDPVEPGDPTTKFIRYLKRRNSIKKPVGREAKNAGSGRPLPIDDPVSYPGEISDAPPGTPEIPSPAEPVPPSPTENGAGS